MLPTDTTCTDTHITESLLVPILGKVRLETQLKVVAPDDEARPERLPVRFLRMLILLRVTSAISLTLLRRQELYSGVGVGVRPGR